MRNTPRDEDGYLRAIAATLTEWNSPEDEDAWGDEALDEQRSASEQEPAPSGNLAPLGVDPELPGRRPPQ